MQNLILDFSHIYPEDARKENKDFKRIDMSDISGTDMYCSQEAEKEIKKRLEPFGPEGIHFLDSGNYHYVTKFFGQKINVPFSLVLFDHHSDMQQPMIHQLTGCGSWAGEMLDENHNLKQLILVGPGRECIGDIPRELKEKLVCISIQDIEEHKAEEELSKIRVDLPAYISIDKDVLDRYGARTNWNQGSMSVETLEKLLSRVFMRQHVIGVDICGECSPAEPLGQLMEDEKVNGITNKILIHFLSPYFQNNGV